MSTLTSGNVTVSCSLSADTTGNLVFQSGGNVTAMTIDSSQNVGIGTSSPPAGSRLAVVGGGIQLSGGTTSQEGLRIQRASGYASITGINNDNNAYNPIAFFTSGTEAARIDSSGRFLVATTTVNNGSLSNFNFQNFANGIETTWSGTTSIYHVLARNGNGFLGGINTSGSTTTYTNLSDYRVKENVQPMQNALSKVNLLKPCTFTYKVDGKDGQGFIAHELQEVFADAVVGEKDAVDADGNPVYQGIDTSFLVATLTAAIQEQQQMIETLQAEVAALKGASA
jgi:hypothetical protein